MEADRATTGPWQVLVAMSHLAGTSKNVCSRGNAASAT